MSMRSCVFVQQSRLNHLKVFLSVAVKPQIIRDEFVRSRLFSCSFLSNRYSATRNDSADKRLEINLSSLYDPDANEENESKQSIV